jgi:basic amino acid/polyamine antiporter, APA family
MESVSGTNTSTRPALKRSLSLFQATLYGLGVTVGAGIYVLIGAAAARAGMHAPIAFLLAAIIMGFSAASFAELGGRLPVAAGEAAYVRSAFRSDKLATMVGLLVIAIAIVSAATVSVGSAGYIAVFVPLPQPVLVTCVVLVMGGVAAWGIGAAVNFAGTMTLIEIGGLVLLIVAGASRGGELITRLPEGLTSLSSGTALGGILGTALLAVFAFIGFEGLANIAEEVREPQRTLPRAIFFTLAISTILYVLVLWISLITVPTPELAASGAPIALVFERLTGASPLTMSAIGIVATLNGIIVQMIMSSRVLYGLGVQGDLPSAFASVSPRTRTPLIATLFTTIVVWFLAVLLPLYWLADITSHMTLVVFALVNLALIRIKARDREIPAGVYVAPRWVPWAGLVSCVVLTLDDIGLFFLS